MGWGIIPAHAGKTMYSIAVALRIWDHPRSRGENVGGVGPARGGQRIIPAHAGKTGCVRFELSHIRDHPRSRGENRMQARRTRLRPGSSPLTRGKR